MKRKWFVLVSLLVLTFLSACNSASDLFAGGNSSNVCTLSRYTVKSQEELWEYYREKARGNTKETLILYQLPDTLAGYKLYEIAESGSYLYYSYSQDGTNPFLARAESRSASSTPDAKPLGSMTAPSSTSSSLPAGSYEPDESYYFLDDISIGWCYTNPQGDDTLQFSVNNHSKPAQELEECPGMYAVDCVTPKGTLYGKMVYWVQYDSCFQASVPINKYEDFLSAFTVSDSPVIQPFELSHTNPK